MKSIKKFIMVSSATYLKESSAKVVLNEYTAYTPDITGMVPAQIWKRQVKSKSPPKDLPTVLPPYF